MSAQSNWQLMSKSDTGALYFNPKNADSVSLVKRSSSSSKPVHFTFENPRAKIQYKGPEDSPITERAMRIAELMANRT